MCVIALLQRGMRVAAVARRIEQLMALKEALLQCDICSAEMLLPIECDVSDTKAVQSAMETTKRAWPKQPLQVSSRRGRCLCCCSVQRKDLRA